MAKPAGYTPDEAADRGRAEWAEKWKPSPVPTRTCNRYGCRRTYTPGPGELQRRPCDDCRAEAMETETAREKVYGECRDCGEERRLPSAGICGTCRKHRARRAG